jgi:hypothetical protein
MPSNWEPPKGFRKAGVLVREDYYQKILLLAARTGKKPWEVLDQALGRGLDGVDVPPAITLDNLFRKPQPKSRK